MSPESSKHLLAYTPMFHGRLFAETASFRNHHFQPVRSGLATIPSPEGYTPQHLHLDGHPRLDRPLFVQFCANSPDEFLEAAKYVQPFCDAVDLNLGCPQGIARKGHYGAFLQEDWDLIYSLINKLHNELDIPVTAKMRVLETKEKTLDYAKVILSAGASIITVHGRRREQKGQNTGLADWSVLRYLRDHLPPETVIFANGNILRHEDISRCLQETGADGVMSAEGNLYDPTIFAEPPAVGDEGREYWRGHHGKGGYRLDAVFRRYMDILYTYVLETSPPKRKPLYLPSDPKEDSEAEAEGLNAQTTDEPPAKRQKHSKKPEKCTSPSLLAMQPHLFHLLRQLITKHTDIRDALARSRAGNMAAFENVLSMVEKAVKGGLIDYASNPAKYEDASLSEAQSEDQKSEDKNEAQTSLAALRACKRPWWVCQPHIRPSPKEALQKGSMTMSRKDRQQLEGMTTLDNNVVKPEAETLREQIDQADGVPKPEIPKESMACG